jgi:hypothetical protein
VIAADLYFLAEDFWPMAQQRASKATRITDRGEPAMLLVFLLMAGLILAMTGHLILH